MHENAASYDVYAGHLIFPVQNSIGVSETTLLYCHVFSTRHSRGAGIYPFMTIKPNPAPPVISYFEGIS